MKLCKKIVTLGATLLLAFCGAQTSSEEPTTKDVKKEETVSATAVTSIIISDGSAKGTTVDLPVGALVSGSKVTLNRVDAPIDFTDLTDADGTNLSFASAPVSVSAVDSTGAAVTTLVSPMTIALPFVAGETYLTVEKSADKLCAVLKSTHGRFVWRKKSITIDTTKGLASFKSLNLGTFQLTYCGDETLPGFEEADAPGVSESLTKFNFTIDSSTYGFGGGIYCVALASRPSDSSEFFASDTFIAGKNAIIDGESLTFVLEFYASKVNDAAAPYLAVLVQNTSSDCTFTETINTKPKFIRAFVFNLTKTAITAGDANGALGAGTYKLYEYKLQTGVPDSAQFSQSTPIPAKDFCIKDKDNTRGFVEINGSTENAGTISGGSSLAVDILRDAATPTIDLTVGVTCADKVGAFNSNSEPYALSLRTPIDGIYYMTSVTMQAKTVATGTNNICLELFNGDAISALQVSDRAGQLLAKFTLEPLVEYSVFLPWDKTKLGTSAPVFDMIVTSNSNCVTTIGTSTATEVPLNDKEMKAKFTL